MWIEEQESVFCNEFRANSFVSLPSKAQFRRQHFTLVHQLWARLVTRNSAYLWWTQGQQKLLTHHHHFSGKAKYPFMKNQTHPPIPGSWRCHEVQALATAHLITGQPRHSTHFQKQLFSSCVLLWGSATPWRASEPLLITVIASCFCFCASLPLPALEEAACHMLSGMFWNRPV